MMKKNMGTIDRVLRAIVGIILIALTLMGKIGIWGWIGVIPLATSAISLCPLYSLIGLNTGTKENEDTP